MNHKDDSDLIKGAQQGDANAFEALVNQYYGDMFKMAFKWCGNKNDAEDITQDACMKLAQGIHSFKASASFTSWLYRLVINAGKDWYKKHNRHPAPSEDIEIIPALNSDGDKKLYAKQVLKAVYEMPIGEREAVLLVMGEGMTHKEAADILECKESTISWRIHEVRKKLEAQFKEEQSDG